ncbi:MAG: hypothetical protein H8D05_01220, partial [FCB group bacterium]|nr:hypothetical protein [FCB group bacterium]
FEHYEKEKEKVRTIIGRIGGQQDRRKDRIFNLAFLVVVALLFIFDVVRNVFSLEFGPPELFLMEVAILLVSLKVIWMIHRQTKVEHFQFWILSSIEFQMNDIARRTRKMEKILEKMDGAGGQN